MSISVLTKFLPRTLEKISSSINGEISVMEQFGKRKIVVGGLTQSGPMAEEVWRQAIKEISTLDKTRHMPKFGKGTELNILILGLGGGSLVKLIDKYFPQAKIIGVEIDPIMVELGKKYLDLARIKNLEIIIDDAVSCINISKHLYKKFDLILVDLYVGDKISENCQSELFLRNIKKFLTKSGVVIFNRLYFKNHIFEANNFLDKLKKIFNDLVCKKVLTNLLILARR